MSPAPVRTVWRKEWPPIEGHSLPLPIKDTTPDLLLAKHGIRYRGPPPKALAGWK